MERATRPTTDAAPCVLRSTETRNASQGLAEALQDLGFLDDLGHPETTSFGDFRSEEHTSELQSQSNLVCRLLLEKKKKKTILLKLSYINPITLDSSKNNAYTT